MSLHGLLTLTIKLPQNRRKYTCDTISKANSSLSITNSNQPEFPTSLYPLANQSVAAIVFGDGSHSRLYPLTKRRSEGALPIAGNYRLIDAVVSNCINSNITKIYALTQFNSTSLNSHLSRAYSGTALGKEGLVEVIAAYQSPEGKGWFQGTADAIRRCLWVLEEYPITEFLILPGHHLYKMDYQKLIEAHQRSVADITVSVINRTKDEDPGFGIFKVNDKNRVENSSKSSQITDNYYYSMGIYVINRDVMVKLLTKHYPLANDLISEVIPGAISLGMKVDTFKFDGYWEDMRSIEAYYSANMESIKKASQPYNFYDRYSPLYTLPRHLPPTLITDATVKDCIIGDGCILNRCDIKGTVVGMRTKIDDGATIEDSIIMGCDTYQTNASEGEGIQIPLGIGKGSRIKKAIIDKNARIGKYVEITNKDNVQERLDEANGYIITGGIVVILRSAVIPDGTIL